MMGIFDKTYELPLTKDYVAHWGMVQAVREFIQNALDSESPFVYEFIDDGDGQSTLRLNSQFEKLLPRTLLLGATSKAGDASTIGSFGEGYKIALLVLTRLGYDTEILNEDVKWEPRFRFNRQFGEEILAIHETTLPDKTNKGLTVIVRGLDDKDREAIVESCLLMQSNIGQIKRTQYGDILFERPRKLYIGGLYICDTELKYGYNIKPEYIRLERDRQTVDSFDLKETTLKAWLDIGDHEFVAKLISDDTPDVQYARWGIPEIVKEECYKLFREQYSEHVVAASQEELKELVKRGMTKVVVVNEAYHYAVSSSRSYRTEKPIPARVTPTAYLQAWLVNNRSEMRTKAIVAFKSLIEVSKDWKS